MTRASFMVAIVGTIVGLPVAASGQDIFGQATQACYDDRDAYRGVTMLENLYKSENAPILVFAQGSCLDYNARYSDAVAAFTRFLESSVPEDMRREAEQRRAAIKACFLTGSPAEGLAALKALYQTTKDNSYLYLQGECHAKIGAKAAAGVAFKAFVANKTNISQKQRAHLQSRIDAVAVSEPPPPEPKPQPKPTTKVAAAEKKKAARRWMDDDEDAAVTKIPSKEEVASNSVDVTAAHTEDPSSDGWGARKIGAAAAVGVGVAGIVTGIVFTARVGNFESQVENAWNNDGRFLKQEEQSALQAQTLQWVGYGIGAAGLAAGAILWYLPELGWTDSNQQLSVMPSANGATLTGRF